MFRKIFFIKILVTFFLLSSFSFVNSEEIFLSLKKNKVNVRYGPSLESPIKFIYKKINLPIKQIDKKENWRRIIDSKNNSGWIHWSQLKPINSVILLKDKILFKKPSNFSRPLANIKQGRVLVVKKCDNNWCKVQTENLKGWVDNKNLWGKVN
ncbi:SH3 domain-containing protein [Candidatus Pelagibacter sp.]|nr:SH3 domain-containing protein [Candidatus Pelagibacter sp.]